MPTAADALLGAGHILAEQISEQAELRGRLREVLQRTGVLVSSRLPVEEKPQPERETQAGCRAATARATAAESPPNRRANRRRTPLNGGEPPRSRGTAAADGGSRRQPAIDVAAAETPTRRNAGR